MAPSASNTLAVERRQARPRILHLIASVAVVTGVAAVMTSASGAALAGQGSPRSAAPLASLRSATPEGCLPLADDPDDPDGALVILMDGTVSSADQTDRVSALVDLVDATTVDRSVAVSVGSFGGSDAEVRFAGCLDGDVFVPDGNNARTRERNRPDLIDGLGQMLADLPADYESSDPTSALRAGVARLAGTEGPAVLVIHTDGIATTGCADLGDEVNLDQPGLVEQLTAACVDAGQLPMADGVDVIIGGVGRTDTDLSADAVTFLITLNTALCEATGATCHVDPNLPTDAWPTSDND